MMIVAATAVIPTAGRVSILRKTLVSLALQDVQPSEIIVVDASDDNATKELCEAAIPGLGSLVIYKKAIRKGAAFQRNQGVESITNPVVFFLDDDIELEEQCVKRLWDCLHADEEIGGVNAMIKNQQYHSPGKLTRFMYELMSGQKILSYAGKCIGPAWNLLPEDRPELPETNRVEWLNTTCTLYKKQALPVPPFPDLFRGYSLLEDLALSLTVARKWKLYNVRNARIFHDSQGGDHKKSRVQLSKMELVNRHHVMTRILNKRSFTDHWKLFLFEFFGTTVVLRSWKGWKDLLPTFAGKGMAVVSILLEKNKNG